jgi:peroxiredoxin
MSRLAQKIEEYKTEFRGKVPKEVQEIMLQATQKLKNTKISKNALRTGDKIPTFTLSDALGNLVDFKIFLQDNDFVVIDFYRGAWCPYCSLELRALQEINDELKTLNTSIVAISPQTPDNSLSTKEKADLEYEVLSDIDNVVAKKFGLVFSLDESLRGIYTQFGIDIPGSNNSKSYEIPMPATYVIDKTGTIIYDFVDEDYTKRLEPQIILEQLKLNF